MVGWLEGGAFCAWFAAANTPGLQVTMVLPQTRNHSSSTPLDSKTRWCCSASPVAQIVPGCRCRLVAQTIQNAEAKTATAKTRGAQAKLHMSNPKSRKYFLCAARAFKRNVEQVGMKNRRKVGESSRESCELTVGEGGGCQGDWGMGLFEPEGPVGEKYYKMFSKQKMQK